MKPAISITTTILGCALAAGLASAQNPTIIQNTRATMQGVSNNATAASNQALGVGESVPSAASVKHAAAKSSGAAVATPVKVAASISASPAVAKSAAKHARVAVAKHKAEPKAVAVAVPASNPPAAAVSAPVPEAGAPDSTGTEQSVTPDSKYAANGRRDPFISPVVSHAGGSGCSTGKKCLEIGAINLRGVVHAESGFIAVVSNGLNKAYFLRENDPVFNGYVMKITGDSIVFQETLQDRLGKSFTREVVKKITTPAV
jgi:hypothetical protein